MSKKGIEPSCLASSTVNWMEGSTVLMCWKNSSLCNCCWTTKVSSTYPLKIFGGFNAVLMLSVQRHPCKYRPQLDIQVTLWQLLWFEKKTWFWNRKYVLFRQNPSSSMMLLADKMVLFGSYAYCSNLSLMTFSADATGIDVKSAVTSHEVIHSPSSILVFLISSVNTLLLLTWWMDLPTRGFRILANSLTTPYVTEPLLGHNGPWGELFLVYLRQPIELWCTCPCRIHHPIGVFTHCRLCLHILQNVYQSIPVLFSRNCRKRTVSIDVFQ